MRNLLLKSRIILLLLCCFIFTKIELSAQTYFPLPTQNAYWTVYEWDENRLVYDDLVYTVDGDTLLNNIQYTKVYKLNDHPTIFDTIRTLHCFMRQENEAKKIWFIRHQYTVGGVCAQGTVELKNGAVIENAMNGITNWHPGDWNAMGGIIIANGATFRNNRRSIEFMKYRNYIPNSNTEANNFAFLPYSLFFQYYCC